MALYIYQAFSRDGKKVSGSLDAPSSKLVREQLLRSGLLVISIELAKEAVASKKGLGRLFEQKVTIKDKIFFTKQLGVLLRSGVPLVDALSLLVEQSEGQLRSIVANLRDGLKEGRSLADGLAMYPKVFETLYIQLIRAGEASGKLDVILERLNQYLERQAILASKIRGALMMPMIQLGVILCAVILLLTFVIPKLASIFDQQGGKLPAPTRMLMGLSDFLRFHYLMLIAIFSGIYAIYWYWKSTPHGMRTIDALKLKMPIVNYFSRMGAVVRFSRTLGMLLESGVNLAESLDIVCAIVDNRILAETLKEAREQIIKQGRVAEYLKKTNLFPPVAIYLINTGEQSGKLDAMLNSVGDQYEADVTERSDGLSAILNPILLIVMAIILGFIIISIMLPIMTMGDVLGK